MYMFRFEEGGWLADPVFRALREAGLLHEGPPRLLPHLQGEGVVVIL